MLRMSRYENWLACRLVRMYLRHTRTECSDWIGEVKKEVLDLDIQHFWMLTQEG